MNLKSNATRILLAGIVGFLFLSGCSEQRRFETVAELEEPVYRRAKDLLDRGMDNEALENFLNLIQRRNGNAPESHLDAGNIYLNHLRDPVSAIYHFKRYKSLLSHRGTSEARVQLDLIDDLIRSGTKAFAASFEAHVYKDPLERLKLLDTITQIRKENALLKEQLSATRTRLNGFVDASRRSQQAAPAEQPRQREIVVPTRPTTRRPASPVTTVPEREPNALTRSSLETISTKSLERCTEKAIAGARSKLRI